MDNSDKNYFSVGLLYSVRELLKLVKDNRVSYSTFPSMFERFHVASPKYVLDLSQKCHWIKFDQDGMICITEKGFSILNNENQENCLRGQLEDMISIFSPSWSALIHKGRKEAFNYFPVNIRQCFSEAGLMNKMDKEIVSWWDRLASASRRIIDSKKMEVGRYGEDLSMQYEKVRTGSDPVWQAIETNSCGYDILSLLDKNSKDRLKIEVKTSDSNPSVANFYITKNEWDVAVLSDNYIFHLWSLRPEPKLFVIDKGLVDQHIPELKGKGIWDKVMIPFSAVMEEKKK